MNKIVLKQKIGPLNLTEKIEDLYIYQDNNTKTYSIFYNDEKKMPLNLEKMYFKKVQKIKNFFDHIFDITCSYDDKEKIIALTYKVL